MICFVNMFLQTSVHLLLVILSLAAKLCGRFSFRAKKLKKKLCFGLVSCAEFVKSSCFDFLALRVDKKML